MDWRQKRCGKPAVESLVQGTIITVTDGTTQNHTRYSWSSCWKTPPRKIARKNVIRTLPISSCLHARSGPVADSVNVSNQKQDQAQDYHLCKTSWCNTLSSLLLLLSVTCKSTSHQRLPLFWNHLCMMLKATACREFDCTCTTEGLGRMVTLSPTTIRSWRRDSITIYSTRVSCKMRSREKVTLFPVYNPVLRSLYQDAKGGLGGRYYKRCCKGGDRT